MGAAGAVQGRLCAREPLLCSLTTHATYKRED